MENQTKGYRDIIRGSASGQISIYKIINGERVLMTTRKNLILPNSKVILGKTMAGDVTAKITNIRVYSAGVLKSPGVVTTTTYAGIGIVEYEALIPAADFAGAFDKVLLSADDLVGVGALSEVTGLAENKAALDPLLIVWTIKFI